MWIERDISARIERLATQRPAIVLTGARQVGKTALLQRLFPKHTFVSLDLPMDAALAENEPREFFSRYPPPVIIDEVQYAPGLFRHLKASIDAHRKSYGRYILTGSQSFTLMKNISDSLAGRAAILELEALSWREVHGGLANMRLEEALLRGGYPELYDNLELDAADYHRSYLSTYLERDVRSLINVGSLRDFERFVRACALRSGQLLNKAELARDVGISSPTANQWLGVLAASNQVFLLEPWFTNGTKSMVKSPKLYWSDVGFMAWLIGVRTQSELAQSPHVGALWETFVCSELRKRLQVTVGAPPLHFWRDRDLEVDFVINRGGRFELMEAKWAREPTARDAVNLLKVEERLGAKYVLSKQVLCRAEKPVLLDGAWAVGPNAEWLMAPP